MAGTVDASPSLEVAEGLASDLIHLEPIAGGVERLQALAGDVDDDALVGRDVAALGELGQDADRDAAGGLGEDAGRLGEQPDPGADLVIGHGSRSSPRSARQADSA